MTATPIFNQLNAYLYALSTLADAGVTGYWAGYAAAADGALGASATTSKVWQDTGGFYLFLDHQPADWSAFTTALAAIRPEPYGSAVPRFVWINQADQAPARWIITTAFARATGSGEQTTWTLVRSCAFSTGAYQLLVYGGVIHFIPDTEGGGIDFIGGGMFNGPEGGYAFTDTRILFSSNTLGCFTALLTVPVPAPAQSDVWTALHIGLQYAAQPVPLQEPQTLVQLSDATEDKPDLTVAFASATRILFMPVFERQTTPLQFFICFDPLLPMDPSRTTLSFPIASEDTIPVLDSYLRTTLGYTIRLTPLPGNGSIPAARFVFGCCTVQQADPADGLRYHLSPEGAFQLSVKPYPPAGEAPVVPAQLLLGLSGLEYAQLGSADYMIVCKSGQPAFIPYVPDRQTHPPDVSMALTNAATTSYFTVMTTVSSDDTPVYYAQPREAPVFSGHYARVDGILDFNPMPAFSIAYSIQQLHVFPMGIYTGLTSAEAALAREIENATLAPYRNYCIGKAYGIDAAAPAIAARSFPKRRVRDGDPLGVTPQGLIAELTTDYLDFGGLIVGNMPGTRYPSVDLTTVEGMFKQALQSNQLFFVASDVTEFMHCTSVRYALPVKDKEKPFLQSMNVPDNIIDAVYMAVQGKQPFPTEGDFVDCILAAAGSHLDTFLKVAGILKVEMDGWTFQLSPRTWRTDPESPTLMVAKFCKRSLIELAADSSSWSWPGVASSAGSLAATQAALQKILNAAADPEAGQPLKIFFDTVANNSNWNGFLFLNAPVDISEMPDDLRFLTAGIDLHKFYAHHIGFSQTAFVVDNGVPELKQTAAFGLIDYNDPVDLYADESVALDFKTTRLRVRFANAALADFAAEVELMLNSLLASSLSKAIAARGNNLIIEGSYQRVGGSPRYSFVLSGQNVFNAVRSALSQFEVLSVQLVNGSDSKSPDVRTTFILEGNLRFMRIPTFDMFCFGPGEDESDCFLRYNGFCIHMFFSLVKPNEHTFSVTVDNTGFDQGISNARTSSLINNFPLTVSAMVASPNLAKDEQEEPKGLSPEELGFTSISAPLEQSVLYPSWYGLVYTLDLGTFGGLTGSVSFKISLLAAWSRGETQDVNPVYLGLKLPGISAFDGSFSLQGVLKLGFRSFRFQVYDAGLNKVGYLLRMQRFSLSVLVWSFPPGNSEIVLFGQPGNATGSLGWYAAYSDDKDEKQQAPAINSTEIQRRLRSGRRTPPIG